MNLDHIRLLEEKEVDLVSITGCRNWSMAAVARVCELNEWKSQLEKEGRLSTRTLVERAATLEQSICSQASQMLGNDNFGVVASASQTPAEHAEKLITALFALGANVYLHVLVSGPLPELAEIKDCVSKMIELLGILPDLYMLNRVLWPFCVAGCLATEGEYDFFTNMAEMVSSQAGNGIVSRHAKALAAMKECWAMRRSGHRLCKWTDTGDVPWLLV
jgi:C6 transcription factor Pro1